MENELKPTATLIEMLSALNERKISAVELLELHLSQIEDCNPALNAIVIHSPDQARESARAADQARSRGDRRPLLGLPFTVKDWIEAAGMRSTAGDPGLATGNYVAITDAKVVSRLKAAGAYVLGKTNMAPWGGGWTTDNPVFGRTNNPWNLDYTPGGSTGGGGAAVSAGLSPLEIGNDLAGSVRIPAAFCGIYSHRPSESAWPRTGQIPDGSGLHLPNSAITMAVLGPLARSAEDLSLILDIAAGADQGENRAWRLALPPTRWEKIEDFRVALLPPIPWLPLSDEIRAAQERLAVELSRLGAIVKEALPEALGDLRELNKLGHMLSTAQLIGRIPVEQRKQMAAAFHAEAARLGDDFMEADAIAMEAAAPEYIGWFFQREQFRAALRDFFTDFDVLVTPVSFTLPFRHDGLVRISDDPDDDPVIYVDDQQVGYRRMSVYPYLAGVCGHPASVFPCGLSRDGLPIGLQAIGPYLEDHTALRFAKLAGECMGGYREPALIRASSTAGKRGRT